MNQLLWKFLQPANLLLFSRLLKYLNGFFRQKSHNPTLVLIGVSNMNYISATIKMRSKNTMLNNSYVGKYRFAVIS